MTANHAAIDIGTNSIHLLVARVESDGGFTVLTTEKESVRLGHGPGEIRSLEPAAIERGLAALRRFKAIADSHEATIDAVATSAVREADNGRSFVLRASAELDIDVDVISGIEEARLIHLGVLQALPVFDRQMLLVDIGGGSTEMLIGKSGGVVAARSVKLGHLRLTNRFFPNGEIIDDAVEQCRAFVRSYLVPIVGALKPHGFDIAVGSSGTAAAIGEIIQVRNEGDKGSPGLDMVIDRAELEATIDELTQWPTAHERAKSVGGLSSRRADVIVGGALLLAEIFAAFDIESMTTSPYALREGVLLDRAAGVVDGVNRLADLRRDSLLRMADAFEEDRSHVQHATDLSLELFDQLAAWHGLAVADRELLEAAGLLHNVGLFVSHASHHLHSEYIIRNSDRLVGYTEAEIKVIAQVARYHRRSGPKPTHRRFVALDEATQSRVVWMAGMLRVAIALDRTRGGVVSGVRCSVDDEAITIDCVVENGHDAAVEIFQANNRSNLLAKASERFVIVGSSGVESAS